MIPQNPYTVGPAVGNSPAFVGRQDILEEVQKVLRHPHRNTIVLYGQRRIGKTSILRQLEATLPKETYLPVFFDLQPYTTQSLDRLLPELAIAITGGLGIQDKKDQFESSKTSFRDWLQEMLEKYLSAKNSAEDKAKNSAEDKALVLLFDEFDALEEPEAQQAGGAFFPYLRDQLLTLNPKRLNFVFVIGRKIEDLDKVALSLFKGTPTKQVSLLNYEETVKLIRLSDSETNQTLRWHRAAIKEIWQLTSGHPYLTQYLCECVWNNIYQRKDTVPPILPTAKREDVRKVLADADTLRNGRAMLEWLWEGLPPAERVVTAAMASVGPTVTESQLERCLKDTGIPQIEKLRDAPRSLREWDLIERVKKRFFFCFGKNCYGFRVELLRRWIKECKPLTQVQQDWNNKASETQKQYQLALEFFGHSQLKEALSLVRQALRENSSHIEAILLKADILRTQKEFQEAAEVLENLFRHRPDVARSKLIETWLVWARHLTLDEKRRLELYKQVLQLAPQDSEALRGVAKIWERQGNSAFRREDFKKSLEFYRQARTAYQKAGSLKEVGQIKQQQRVARKKWFVKDYLKLTLKMLGGFIVFGATYWVLVNSYNSPEIILEVTRMNAFDEYKLQGVLPKDDPQHPLVLRQIQVCPVGKNLSIKQASFRYEGEEINLSDEQASSEHCKVFNGRGKGSPFKFLTGDQFTFSFQFAGTENQPVEFKCYVVEETSPSQPRRECKVKEQGYFSIILGFPWYGISLFFSFIVVGVVEAVYWFRRRRH